MFLNRKNISLFVVLLSLSATLINGCASPPPPKRITISEQIEIDMNKAQDLSKEFQRQSTRVSMPEIQNYLNHLAQNLAQQSPGFEYRTVEVRIHKDANPQQSRFFSFPGTTLFVPLSFLKEVKYENELAAALSLEIANVIHRHLAKRLDQLAKKSDLQPPVLFGEGSVFDFDRDERKKSIQTAHDLLYSAKFDTRGLASVFQHYGRYKNGASNELSDLDKKEVEFDIREAQHARSQMLPLRDPVVRSSDFLVMKKRIMK